MPDDRTPPSYPQAEVPAASGAVRPEPRQTLATSLYATVDSIRQVATDLGLRPYRVWRVHVYWPDKKGIGKPARVVRTEILPTPRVQDLSSTAFQMAAFGLTETGGLFMDKISPRYSEDDLLGFTPGAVDPARPRTMLRNVEFFYEVRESRPGMPATQPRRYVPSGVPMLVRGGLEWKVSLTKQDYNPSREDEIS